MSAPEFSRSVRVDTLGGAPKKLSLQADEAERAALARRFGLVAIDQLAAEALLTVNDGAVIVTGTFVGAVVQSCVATGEPVAAEVAAPFEIVFRPQPEGSGNDEEIELAETELDTIFYEGDVMDLGEAVAETLLLNLDPYPRSPGAEEALKAAGVKSEEEASPFAALAALRDKLKK